MEDLERVLQKVVKEQSKKPLTRRFIVTEGLFETVGDCVDLPKLVLTPFAIVRWRITKTSPG
jgi:7-keto-8-aminopelargonate synthetase-like enzyme